MIKPPRQDRDFGRQGLPVRSAQLSTSRLAWTPAPGRGGNWFPYVRPLQSDHRSMFPCTSCFSLGCIPTHQNRLLLSLFGDLTFFRRPQLCTTCSRVTINLFFSGRHWLFCQQLVLALLRSLAPRVFPDAIFQRVKADCH